MDALDLLEMFLNKINSGSTILCTKFGAICIKKQNFLYLLFLLMEAELLDIILGDVF